MNEAKWIWMDGKLVPWADAQVHVLTHSLHYGLAVFEGIRCYKTSRGSAIFRFDEHLERLYDSVKIAGLSVPFAREEVAAATKELIRANGQQECYIRPLVYLGYGRMGVLNLHNPVRVAIATYEWGRYLGAEAIEKGIRAKVSSFTRHHVNVSMTKAKLSGNYANSQLAKAEAVRDGYEEAIMLDTEGYACEGTGENLFLVRHKEIVTPPLSSILDGVTRDSVIALAREAGLEVREDRISRDRLYRADEAFFTGTAAEITPIREIDHRTIGDGVPGPVTRDLQRRFFAIVSGADREHDRWLSFV